MQTDVFTVAFKLLCKKKTQPLLTSSYQTPIT